jgi:hypothetical protein
MLRYLYSADIISHFAIITLILPPLVIFAIITPFAIHFFDIAADYCCHYFSPPPFRCRHDGCR